MKTENDFTKTTENGEVKSSKWGYVLAFVIIAGFILVFAPIKRERTYSDVTEVRLIDMVLVEFEWTAHYKTPLLVLNYNEDRQRFERNIEAVVGNYLNRIIRTHINSKQLFVVGKDSIQIALYESEKVRELPIDTIIITQIHFEQRFVDYLAEQQMLKQQAITDSIRNSNELMLAKQRAVVAKYQAIVAREEKKAKEILNK